MGQNYELDWLSEARVREPERLLTPAVLPSVTLSGEVVTQ